MTNKQLAYMAALACTFLLKELRQCLARIFSAAHVRRWTVAVGGYVSLKHAG